MCARLFPVGLALPLGGRKLTVTKSVQSYDVNDSLNRALDRIEEYRRTSQPYLLLYAALDTRLCTERTLFEYLVLIKSTDLPKRLERLYSATDLKKAIITEEPQFLRKLEFMNLFVRFLPYNRSIVIPELDLLSEAYGRMNDYLHAPKRPYETWQDPDWWARLAGVLDSVVQHLVEIHSGLMGHIDLKPQGEALFEKFAPGEVSSEQVTAELEETFKSSPMKKV